MLGPAGETSNPEEVPLELGDLEALQQQEETLKNAWWPAKELGEGEVASPWFRVRNGLLYRED